MIIFALQGNKMRYKVCIFLFVTLLVSGKFSAYAGNDAGDMHHLSKISVENQWITLNLRPSYIMPTHGFYNGWNDLGQPLRIGFNTDIQYGFSFSGRSAYQGCGLGMHSFGSNHLLGTPVSLYIFQGAPLFRLTDRLNLGYEWNFGISAGWKDNGVVTVSPLNAYINISALLSWRPDDHWYLNFGPEYTHFSNGDTKFPNGGANMLNLRIGARYLFNPKETVHATEKVFEFNDSEEIFRKRISYDLTVFGSWRADRFMVGGNLHVINRAFPVAGLNFNPLYHFNDYLGAGASLDLIYDGSANLFLKTNENGIETYSVPDFTKQIAAGLSARAELKMPIFAVNIGIGYNLLHSGQDLKGLYGIFALKAFVTEMLYLNVGYRLSSVLYSHNLMFGLGIRL